MRKILVLICCLPVLLGARPLLAAEDRGTFNLLFENDLFGSGDDGHYTHGTRLSYLSSESAVPEMVKQAASYVPLFAIDGRLRVSYALGQSIFTPDDVSVEEPQPGERPYAGWLFGSVGLVSDNGRRLDNLELTVGVVGPDSFAEETQTFWHKLINTTEPKGWDNQLKNELGIVLTYEQKLRAYREFTAAGLGVDLTPHVGGSIGNVFTHAAGGLTVRIGDDLPNDYGPPRIRPSLPGSGFFVPDDRFGWYLFAGVEGRLVARNIFLDGNTFADSPSVDKKYLVGDFQAGIVLTIGNVRLAYTHILRSKEFEGQDDPDEFGAVSVSVRF